MKPTISFTFAHNDPLVSAIQQLLSDGIANSPSPLPDGVHAASAIPSHESLVNIATMSPTDAALLTQNAAAIAAHTHTATNALPPHAVQTTPPSEFDADGLPWDERIHSSTHTKTDKGVWAKRRGAPPQLVAQIRAELFAKRGNSTTPAATNPSLGTIPPAATGSPNPHLDPVTENILRAASDIGMAKAGPMPGTPDQFEQLKRGEATPDASPEMRAWYETWRATAAKAFENLSRPGVQISEHPQTTTTPVAAFAVPQSTPANVPPVGANPAMLDYVSFAIALAQRQAEGKVTQDQVNKVLGMLGIQSMEALSENPANVTSVKALLASLYNVSM